VQSLTAVNGEIAPAPELPRWIAYGDWTTQGWIASGPSHGWAAIAARKAGLDLVNLGYAGAGRGEVVSAEHIAALPADVITLAFGASCWTRVPHSAAMVTEGFHGFLDIVRQGHPTTPIVVMSPIVRPDAEDVPNKLGASMSDIRHAIESVARERIVRGDATLTLVAGESIINDQHLADGIHPGDEGHKRIAATLVKALGTAMRATGETPGIGALRDEAHRLEVQSRPVVSSYPDDGHHDDGHHDDGHHDDGLHDHDLGQAGGGARGAALDHGEPGPLDDDASLVDGLSGEHDGELTEDVVASSSI
jgi:lysophospholipase L1-like esterase